MIRWMEEEARFRGRSVHISQPGGCNAKSEKCRSNVVHGGGSQV